MFSYKRLCLARQRRRFTAKALAETAGISAVTISRLENGENVPDEETVAKLAKALRYPTEFFFKDDPEILNVEAVSFRSLSKMSARERDAAIQAGVLGLEVADWIEEKFNLPKPDLIDLSYETDPEAAARSLRQYWGMGEKPIGNMIRLLEAKGIRVFSLSENTETVDAFSFWRNDKPFIFLNNFKTPEHSITDAGHELGHLIMHRHGGTQPKSEQSRPCEREANQFASAFLMPLNDIKAQIRRPVTVTTILNAKKRWRVSAMALAYRLHAIGHLSEWQYKSICIELTRRGFRKGEPGGIEREVSAVWQKVLTQLWAERTTKDEIAASLNVPLDELEGLIWGLTGITAKPSLQEARKPLHLVK
jgi:Zn-dependent peptidase ImmA (M78 family)/DNA-binding XRE family transcriptional regulator